MNGESPSRVICDLRGDHVDCPTRPRWFPTGLLQEVRGRWWPHLHRTGLIRRRPSIVGIGRTHQPGEVEAIDGVGGVVVAVGDSAFDGVDFEEPAEGGDVLSCAHLDGRDRAVVFIQFPVRPPTQPLSASPGVVSGSGHRRWWCRCCRWSGRWVARTGRNELTRCGAGVVGGDDDVAVQVRVGPGAVCRRSSMVSRPARQRQRALDRASARVQRRPRRRRRIRRTCTGWRRRCRGRGAVRSTIRPVASRR